MLTAYLASVRKNVAGSGIRVIVDLKQNKVIGHKNRSEETYIIKIHINFYMDSHYYVGS